MLQSSFFSSAQAHRLPLLSKQSPLARPHGCMNVESLPSTLHFMIRSFGWSVKKIFPSASQAGPSVNSNSPESLCGDSPGAMSLLSAAVRLVRQRKVWSSAIIFMNEPMLVIGLACVKSDLALKAPKQRPVSKATEAYVRQARFRRTPRFYHRTEARRG